MSQSPILVVEDEDDILQLILYNLKEAGYAVRSARSGEDALTILRNGDISLVLLDLMLPGISGGDISKIIRNDPRTKHIPIIMVTAKGTEKDVISGLELGADDYITKPFSINILLSRIKAVLRRIDSVATDEHSVINIHGIRIDPRKHRVDILGEPLEMTYSEFAILHLLAMRPGWAFSRNQIIDNLHGQDHPITDRAVDVMIVGLRKKLSKMGYLIETVRGIGYRMKENIDET